MDTLELYQGLKTGKIKKSQLNEQQIGDVYKYMVDSKKVSVNQIKPETVKKFNLGSNTNTAIPKTSETYSPFKIKTNLNTPNYEQPKIKPIAQQTKSANPENDLVDLLSNLSMNRGKTVTNPRSQVGPTSQYLPKIDASKQGEWGTNPIKSAGTNLWAGFGDLGRGVANVVDMTLGDKNIPLVDNYLNAIKKDTSKEDARLAEINQGNVGEFAGQVFRGIGQSIPSVGIGLAGAPIAATNPLLASNGTQLVSNAAQLSNPTLALTTQQALTDIVKNPNLIPSMVQSVGNQYDQAIKDGATKEQAIKSSLLGGIPSGLIEVMGGTENLAKKLASKMSIGKLTIESGLGEAFEEIMQYPLENLGQKVAYDSSMPYFSTTENAVINPGQQGYNAATAFVSSALMGGVGGAINNGINKISNNNQPQNYNQQITNLQTGIDEDLKTMYQALDNKQIGGNIEQGIDANIQILELTKQAYPELTDFFDEHINKLNEYKIQVTEKPQDNENNINEQLVNDDTNVVQNVNNDVISDIDKNNIQPVENVSNIETQQIEDVPHIENQVVSEPINQDSTMQEIAQEPIIENQQETKPIVENDNVNNYTETVQKKQVDELNKDNPYLENDFNPFEETDEWEKQVDKREMWLNNKLENIKTAKFTKTSKGDSQYATVTPSIKNSKYQITIFDKNDTPIMDSQRDTIEEIAKELDNQGFTYIDEINYNNTEIATDTNVGSKTEPKTIKTQNSTGVESFKGNNTKTNTTTIDINRPLKSITNIKKDISKLFNISISDKTNKFAKRKALGYYKVMPEVIRTKYNNQLGVVMHELGHHLDKQYQFNSKSPQLIKSMISKMDENFKKAYKASELPGEAIAEFLRYYTTDTQTAIEFGGDFYNLFENSLSKKDLKNIQEIRSDTLRWVNAEQDEKFDSTMVSAYEDKKSIKEKINAEEINMLLFDDLISLDRFSKVVEDTTGRKLNPKDNPYYLSLMTRKNGAIIDGILTGDTIDTKFKIINKKDNLNKIVDDVGKDNIDSFERYLKMKHALTLKEQGHQVLPDAVEVSKERLEALENQYPKFKEQSERLYKWYDTFFKAWVVDTNMLGKDSKKIYEVMKEKYPYYVPMFRSKKSLTGDKSTKVAKDSFTDQKSPVDRLSEKGSDRDTIRPLDGIIMQVNRMVNAYTKNNVMRSIVKNYNNVDGLGMFIDKVSPDMEKKMISTQGIKNELDKNFASKLDSDTLESIIDSIDDVLVSYTPTGYSKDNDVVTMIADDGSRQFYEVFDVNLFKSLTNMNKKQLDFTVKMIAAIRRNTTSLTTGLNPIFGVVSNFPRDIQQAYVFGSYKDPFSYAKGTAKAIYEVVKKTDNYKQFMNTGGGYGASMFGADRKMTDTVSKKLEKRRKGNKYSPKNSFDYMIEFIEQVNDWVETAPRLAEYNKVYSDSKKNGMREYDARLNALYKSNDVTLNFLKHGTITNTAIGQTIPYFNAGLQGIDKLKRGLITDTETRKQTWVKAITTLALPTVLLWLYHKDDEDYNKLSRGIKDTYWILWKNDDGSYVRIPKPKDIALLFSADFERGLDAFFKGQGKNALDGLWYTASNSLLPPMDTVFRPMIDVAKNKKWSGSPIVSQSLESLTKQNQYDDTTSRLSIGISKGIAKVFPNSSLSSPKNMDYLIDQYWGGLADIVLPLSTPNSYSTAEFLRRKFVADPSYSNDIVSKFYDLKDLTTKANNSYEKKNDFTKDVDFAAEQQFKLYYKSINSYWKDVDYIGKLKDKQINSTQAEIFKNLINYSRFEDSEKNKVIEDLKDNKLDDKSITLLQKTIRDEIVNLADKAIKEYKQFHEENNKYYKDLIKPKK